MDQFKFADSQLKNLISVVYGGRDLNKAEFIGNVAESASMTKVDADRAVSAVFGEIKKCMEDGDSLTVPVLALFLLILVPRSRGETLEMVQ